MKKNYKKSLFIFRRDLRLDDNTGLITALQNSEAVIPCFIFDPRQIGDQNSFRSYNAIQGMLDALNDLQIQLKKRDAELGFLYGIAEEVIENLIPELVIDAVFLNQDYTPFSVHRDHAIASICKKNSIDCISSSDLVLHDPHDIAASNGKPFQVFTPFYKKATRLTVMKPIKNHYKNYSSIPTNIAKSHAPSIKKFLHTIPRNPTIAARGGRKEALTIINSLSSFHHYQSTRNFPAIPTTGLSLHNKFGTISIRELYYAIKQHLGNRHEMLTRQLYWRDFFTYIAFHFPKVFGSPFREKFENIHWENSRKKFDVWCMGKTGFPLVDAGMRQLKHTGFMHNRVRMVSASFLVKDLHIDWQWGERYFATQLIDYDPAVNNGNWQWVASTGCDAQPYFRIFNPWLQQAKYDPQCIYIKTWIPELNDVDNKIIHRWYKQQESINDYPLPIIDHTQEAHTTKKLYRTAKT